MSHEWHRWVLTTSSWHGLEEIGVMADDSAMIAAGERWGAWPTAVRFEDVVTASGIAAPGRAVVASYGPGFSDTALGVVGRQFRATTPKEWRSLVRAAVAAGAKPTGAFALREGSRVLATFEVGGAGNGLRTQLVLADAFDGSMRLQGGFSSIRVVCANTLSAAMSQDGDAWAALRHTASLEVTVNALRAGIASAIASGDKVRAAFERAEQTTLTPAQYDAVFDKLFPAAPEDAPQGAKTRADNARRDARLASAMAVNYAGPTMATLWNGATYLVDRTATGETRKTRGGSLLDSLLFGARGVRIAEIRAIIDTMSDEYGHKA